MFPGDRGHVSVALFEEVGGRRERKFHRLALDRDSVESFALHWTVVHPITADSPLCGVTPDSLQADGKVTLQPSTIGGVEITRANVDGTYKNATGEIRTLEIVGRDVNVQASGTLALDDTGQSNLKVHADSPSLAEIGKLVDQPITGIGKIDATITGNKRELQATGTLVGDDVKYRDNGALTVSSDFTAKPRRGRSSTNPSA